MSKGLIFFCCACAILLFTIINLSVAPIINGRVYTITGTQNCKKLSDEYDEAKKGVLPEPLKKYYHEWGINECNRKKAMYNMEYTSLIFDMVIGFICGLLGLLHHFEVKKEFVPKTGIIGLGCGIVGFAFTFVYIIFNGLVYTSYYEQDIYYSSIIYKTDSNGAFAEWKNGKYECLYYDEPGNSHAIRAKYSDLIKKQYNYNRDLDKEFASTNTEAGNCHQHNPEECLTSEGYITPGDQYPYVDKDGKDQKCKYLYHHYGTIYNSNKDKSQRFLTTLILSLLVCLANIGLAIFGFLLFRTPGEF